MADPQEQQAEIARQGKYDPSDLELRMAASIMFMPEIGPLPVGVTREIIRRCCRCAEEEFAKRLDRAASDDFREGFIET